MESKYEEQYRLTGALPAGMIEDLLDDQDKLEKYLEADYHLCDAVANIGEDFAQAEISELARIIAGMRKSGTKEALLFVLGQFEDMQTRIANEAAHSSELIGKARACLN